MSSVGRVIESDTGPHGSEVGDGAWFVLMGGHPELVTSFAISSRNRRTDAMEMGERLTDVVMIAVLGSTER